MTTRTTYPLVCGGCGRDGKLHMAENDAPFTTQWESWSVSPFQGLEFSGQFALPVAEALRRLAPVCDGCRSTEIRLDPGALKGTSSKPKN